MLYNCKVTNIENILIDSNVSTIDQTSVTMHINTEILDYSFNVRNMTS